MDKTREMHKGVFHAPLFTMSDLLAKSHFYETYKEKKIVQFGYHMWCVKINLTLPNQQESDTTKLY